MSADGAGRFALLFFATAPRAPVARVVVTRALVGGKGGFGQLLRNLGRAGGGVRTSAEI